MKRLLSLGLALLALVLAPPITSAADDEVRVMTRNQYLGADLGPILGAPTPAAFIQAVLAALNQIAANDFPQRAEALAQEIADKRPHLVGLQEVFRFTLNKATGAPPFRDQLDDLMKALAARGASYYVAGQVQNLTIAIPIPGFGIVEAIDRDIVLARADVAASPVTLTGCRPSLDGCNFSAVVTIPSAVGPIRIDRGFVIVDAMVGLQPVRFANTHLEIPELPLQVQAAQARELIGILGSLPNPEGSPTVVVGDINSAPTDQTVFIGGAPIVPPYLQFAQAGLADVWLLRPGRPPGFTCCEQSDLSNPESIHFKRIDVIFTSGMPAQVEANLVGVDPEDKTTPLGLWPSDHAGVVARLRFIP